MTTAFRIGEKKWKYTVSGFLTPYVKWFNEKHGQRKVPLTVSETFNEWNTSGRSENTYKAWRKKYIWGI